MTNRINPALSIFSLVLFAALVFSTAPARSQPTTQASRSPQAIAADLQQSILDLRQTMNGGQAFRSAEARKKAAPQAIADIHKILRLFDEMSANAPQAKPQLDQSSRQFRLLAMIFDDPQETATAQKLAQGNDLPAAQSKASIAIADYVKASDDPGRIKALDAFGDTLKLYPSDTGIIAMIPLTSLAAPPSSEVSQHLLDILQKDAQGPEAQQLAQQMSGNLEQHQMENKPLVIEGIALSNPKFSTADWKGKVILVDFWATWCGPCLGELPRVKKMYADYHTKGLEVLGVSCDNSADDLKKFLSQNPDMPWPQLFDEKNPGWNPIATSYGIDAIPTMFLIDRKGILRTVDARSQMEDLIPKLLAERP